MLKQYLIAWMPSFVQFRNRQDVVLPGLLSTLYELQLADLTNWWHGPGGVNQLLGCKSRIFRRALRLISVKLALPVLKSCLLIFKVICAQEGNRVPHYRLFWQCLFKFVSNLVLVVLGLVQDKRCRVWWESVRWSHLASSHTVNLTEKQIFSITVIEGGITLFRINHIVSTSYSIIVRHRWVRPFRPCDTSNRGVVLKELTRCRACTAWCQVVVARFIEELHFVFVYTRVVLRHHHLEIGDPG